MTGEDSSYQAHTARKGEKLTRRRLDCGHRGDAYQHIWCDRLACKKCADLDHDCSAFGGAKDRTGEVSEPAEAAADLDRWATTLDAPPTTAVDITVALEVGGWTRFMQDLVQQQPHAVTPYRCRGCRLWIAQDAKLCGPCSALPSCGAGRLNALTGRAMACFRPAGHEPPHEEVLGSAWGPDDCTPVEAARREPFLMAAIDVERGVLFGRLGEALTQMLAEPPPARRPWWKRWPW